MAYDFNKAFNRIEGELTASMIRNMKKHRIEEVEQGIEWTQWQALQLQALNEYRVKNKKMFDKRFETINHRIERAIKEANKNGQTEAEAEILERVLQGKAKIKPRKQEIAASFFAMNDSKMDALLNATMSDMQKAEVAVLRRANDKYRKAIFDAQVYANSGAGTYEQAVDMATKDFLKKGIDCIEYSNGARHCITDYAMMAIRTASKRAYLIGQAEKREEWGIHTVIVNKRTNPCPKCAKWVGKILIDDVYGSGSAADGNYPLLSTAISEGFLHPNCKDSYTTYFPDVTPIDEPVTKDEYDQMAEQYVNEQKKQIAKNNAAKFQRVADNSLDIDNQKRAQAYADRWENLAADNTLTYEGNNGTSLKTKPLKTKISGTTKKNKWDLKVKPSEADINEAIKFYEDLYKQDYDYADPYKKWLGKAEALYDKQAADLKASGATTGKVLSVLKKKKKYTNKITVIDLDNEIANLNTEITQLTIDQMNAVEIKTYDGIWKNKSVSTTEYNQIKDSISGKIDYYKQQIANGITPELEADFTNKIAQLQELNTNGIVYNEFEKLIAAKKALVDQKTLEIENIVSPKKKKATAGFSEGYDQARKDKANWFKSPESADKFLRADSGKAWNAATRSEKNAIYEYTKSYCKYNEPLRGYEYGTSRYVGVGKIDLDQIGVSSGKYKPGRIRKEMNDIISIINRSEIPGDMWTNRGVHYNGMDKFFNIDMSDFYLPEDELQKKLIGTKPIDHGFCSMGDAKGKGFGGDIELNIFMPKGTRAMYIEPISYYGWTEQTLGHGLGKNWDGLSEQAGFGYEAEILLQRETQFIVTKVEKNNGKIWVDLEVIGQNLDPV